MRRGLFVTFEGIDGSGKTTQVERLMSFLRARGRQPREVREPGGTRLGETLRKIVLSGADPSPWAEASLFAAARAQLYFEVIRPSLEQGMDVICDRFIDSSLAYQSGGRGLDQEPIYQWNLALIENTLPDLTFLLLLPAEDATRRLAVQLSLFQGDEGVGPTDRLERESIAFRRRVEEKYRELAATNEDRIKLIDASMSIPKVAKIIERETRKALRELEAGASAGKIVHQF